MLVVGFCVETYQLFPFPACVCMWSPACEPFLPKVASCTLVHILLLAKIKMTNVKKHKCFKILLWTGAASNQQYKYKLSSMYITYSCSAVVHMLDLVHNVQTTRHIASTLLSLPLGEVIPLAEYKHVKAATLHAGRNSPVHNPMHEENAWITLIYIPFR